MTAQRDPAEHGISRWHSLETCEPPCFSLSSSERPQPRHWSFATRACHYLSAWSEFGRDLDAATHCSDAGWGGRFQNGRNQSIRSREANPRQDAARSPSLLADGRKHSIRSGEGDPDKIERAC